MKYYIYIIGALLLINETTTNYLTTHRKLSNLEIEDLKRLYENGLAETQILVQSAAGGISSAIDIEYNNITQHKLASAQLIANSTSQSSHCKLLHSDALSKINPDAVFVCEQSEGINAAVNKWQVIKRDIFLCSKWVSSGCVERIRSKIVQTQSDNMRDIPDLARRAYSCVRLQSDIAVNAIFEANKNFYKCTCPC